LEYQERNSSDAERPIRKGRDELRSGHYSKCEARYIRDSTERLLREKS
jgi:hypothetical protein